MNAVWFVCSGCGDGVPAVGVGCIVMGIRVSSCLMSKLLAERFCCIEEGP